MGLSLALAAGRPVGAHAVIDYSNPPAGSVIGTPPERVTLYLTEALEAGFSRIQVLDAAGSEVHLGDSQVDPVDPTVMSIELADLPEGTYTIIWRALSRVDGHITSGALPFVVGDPALVEAAPAAAQSVEAEEYVVSTIEVVLRWAVFLTLSVTAGYFAFFRLIARSIFAGRMWAARLERPMRGLTLSARWVAVAMVIALILAYLLQASSVSEATDLPALLESVAALAGIRYGSLSVARLVLGVALLGLVWETSLRSPAVLAGWRGIAGATLGAGALLATTLNSHSAATGPAVSLPVLMDWLHLLAVSAWAGGLPILAGTLAVLGRQPAGRELSRATATLVNRFSNAALASVAVLVVTGAFSAVIHVGNVQGLVATDHGRALMLKIALVVIALALGAINLLRVKPALVRTVSSRRANAAPFRWLRRTTGAETVVIVAIFLVAGFLTASVPAAVLNSVSEEAGARHTEWFDEGEARLTIRPGQIGRNLMEVAVRDAWGNPLDQVDRVRLLIGYLDQNLGETEVVLEPIGNGSFRVDGSQLSLAGGWEIVAAIRFQSGDERRVAYPLLTMGAGPATFVSQPTLFDRLKENSTVLLGLEVFIVGALLALLWMRLSRIGASRLARVIPALGSQMALIVGMYLIYTTTAAELSRPPPLENPFRNQASSIAAGSVIYEQNCVVCHGEEGRGDGPLAASLSPKPVDLREHTAAHTESVLYQFISRGVQGTAMPAFEESLSDEERWHVLNFIVDAFPPVAGAETGGRRP